MIGRRLHAWDGDRLVGTFTRDDDGNTSFEYEDIGGMPISLSLPIDGDWERGAPAAFLDNLLPDNPNARTAMGLTRGFGTTDTFDLLADVDSVGGLVFTQEPEPPHGDVVLAEATVDQLADEADRIARTGNNWWDDDMHCRFSLAGAQGKFTLTRLGGAWYWPNALLPSTHIIKPTPRLLPDAAQVEAATMRLAALCGLDTPVRFTETMGGTTAYVVERFDRRVELGRIRRIRQEDLLQAMGLPSKDKYKPTATTASTCSNAPTQQGSCATNGWNDSHSLSRPRMATPMRRTVRCCTTGRESASPLYMTPSPHATGRSSTRSSPCPSTRNTSSPNGPHPGTGPIWHPGTGSTRTGSWIRRDASPASCSSACTTPSREWTRG